MAGKIKKMIDSIIEQRSKGNLTIISTTKTKLTLKGIRPDAYSSTSEDDPVVIEKLFKIAEEMNIKLN